MDDGPPDSLNETRPPSDEDLAGLARALNDLGANCIVIGGFAINAAGGKITTPGLQQPVEEQVAFVTENCIRMDL